MQSPLILFFYCTVVYNLFQKMGIAYTASDLCFFIVSFKQSLKVVLSHNRNYFHQILVPCAVQKKKDQESILSIKIFLKLIDFEMIVLLVGLQGRLTKYSCFLYMWNSCADEQHYLAKKF